MAALSAIEVLRALDAGVSELHQVLGLLRAAGHDPLELAIGAGDRALVELVAAVTGAPIEFAATCGSCGEINEIAVGPAELPPYEPASRWLGPRLGVREPTYGDLLDLSADPAGASAQLGQRCSIGAVPADRFHACLDDVDNSLAGPIEMACVACAEAIVVDADIELLALERLCDVAARAEHEIHLLAAAYAWDLTTIEALPDARRGRLARMVEAG